MHKATFNIQRGSDTVFIKVGTGLYSDKAFETLDALCMTKRGSMSAMFPIYIEAPGSEKSQLNGSNRFIKNFRESECMSIDKIFRESDGEICFEAFSYDDSLRFQKDKNELLRFYRSTIADELSEFSRLISHFIDAKFRTPVTMLFSVVPFNSFMICSDAKMRKNKEIKDENQLYIVNKSRTFFLEDVFSLYFYFSRNKKQPDIVGSQNNPLEISKIDTCKEEFISICQELKRMADDKLIPFFYDYKQVAAYLSEKNPSIRSRIDVFLNTDTFTEIPQEMESIFMHILNS